MTGVSIRVLLFAGLRERAGTSEFELSSVPEGSTVDDVLEMLRARWSFLDGFPLATALNRELVGAKARLRDGDELALLPPVSGG